ncbi:hypothetical protein MCOR25_005173 [Pyricularia grisea]|uniref:tRNA dimethylallyltransferase n=1 Tax=Pyricularia grisea TaxID=148305 RepID=A0A6P8BGU2_PYRGI|nr:uncharacterized protein PgNI_01473 [Pyricularia grisea]KAI6366358.1 hypothetical protein MCOR25_005173 [Pyricularia grisea]TLD15872.1 hypothetical protein PgNI_01473 [Pyricularia grisea]
MWAGLFPRIRPFFGLRPNYLSIFTIRRNASRMSSQQIPSSPEPLVVVMGSTGTGKSDLAVEIARRFNGEIINADAMQMYEGLPIITNKITPEEQRGVPHHLLGMIGLEEPTWNVHHFRREASSIIREIRSRGHLPILVGGTHYYLDGLLFDHHLVAASPPPEEGDKDCPAPAADLPATPISRDPALEEASTEELMARLREVDPVEADRRHPKDRRKIMRSLEIYLTTGRRASDIYAEQRETKAKMQQQRRPSDGDQSSQQGHAPIFFWVHSERGVLNDRLERRVDKMLDNGLIEETRQMHAYLRRSTLEGITIDRTTGIWQSIGFSEIEPYLDALHRQAEGESIREQELGALKLAGVDLIKQATRRYAKGQVRWITYKTLPLIQDANMLPNLFLMDSTDVTRWSPEVVDKALNIMDKYLGGLPLPEPAEVSKAAREVLGTVIASSNQKETPCNKTCEVCHITVLTEEKWLVHIRGHRHKRAVKSANKRAFVAAYLEGKERGAAEKIQDENDDEPVALRAEDNQ